MKTVNTHLLTIVILILSTSLTIASNKSRHHFSLKDLRESKNSQSNDYFGCSVAVSGDFAIVGAHGDDEHGRNSGAAYVYWHFGSVWNQIAKLTLKDAAPNDHFGHSVAIKGETAVISTYSTLRNKGTSNAAYVFKKNNYNWEQVAKLTPSDPQPYDYFGCSVAVSKGYIIVGANGVDDNGNNSGAAYVFHRKESQWTEIEKLSPPNSEANDYFGCAVSIDEKYAIIGASGKNQNTGSAYIFRRKKTKWNIISELHSSDGQAGDGFGKSVAISDEAAIIGAYGYDGKDQGLTDSGAAYIFEYSTPQWEQAQILTAHDASSNSRFGYSVGISGDKAIVSAYSAKQLIKGEGSFAYIFSGIFNSETTSKIKILKDDGAPVNLFGTSVGISDNKNMVGIFLDENDSTQNVTYALLPAYSDL